MRLPGETEEGGMGTPVIYMIVAVSAFVLIILAVVFISNGSNDRSGNQGGAARASAEPTPEEEQVEFAKGQEDIESLYKEHKLRAEDLDFWNMYQDDDEVIVEAAPTESPMPTEAPEPTDEEKAKDGMHTRVTYRDGTEEWIEISEDIPLYTYDLTNIKITNDQMSYWVEGEKTSKLGVDISKSSGEVDFEALRDNGVDFVMIRLGSRGYETGLLSLDEKFVLNITQAQNAGLEVGVTFFSQAVTVEEAVEEAEYVASNLIPYQITYPVAFDMEYIANDKARIEILDEDQKTQIAEAFLKTVESEGYRSILYGNKTWLLTEIIPDKILAEYDVWLSDQSPVPDYPYQFKMWKYTSGLNISGVENETAYIISFVDYTRK
ncbi:MAG: GH25 family lysozyme [Bacillota bacterium]|nr:GH25 family lysozyme [Bacillota bacterium]